MPPDNETSLLREAREACKQLNGNPWRLQDLSDATGYSKGSLSMFEHGYVPKHHKRLVLAKAVNKEPKDLWPEHYAQDGGKEE